MPEEKSQSWWQTVPGMLTAAAAILTAFGGVITAMNQAGCFHSAAKSNAPAAAATSAPAAPPVSQPTSHAASPPEEPAPKIYLRYTGDPYGCALALHVRIGKVSALPTSNLFEMTGLKAGRNDYQIEGTISCGVMGTCSASGSGVVDVRDGATYDVIWRNIALARCGAELRASP